MIGPIRAVTLGVSSLERSLALYRDLLGLRVEREVEVDSSQLAVWGLPQSTSARLVELSCLGYPVGRLRLVEYDPPATVYVRRDRPGQEDTTTDLGPRAFDFYPAKPVAEALAEIEAAGYQSKSRPIRHDEGEIRQTEVVFYGPDGEGVLIMEAEVGHEGQRRDFAPAPFSEVATVSVTCGDADLTRELYGGHFGFEKFLDVEIPEDQRDLVCTLVGAPPGTRITFLAYQQPGEPSGKYLFIYFHGASTRGLTGGMRPGHLGLSLYTHDVADLDAAVRGPGLAVEQGPAEAALPEGGRARVALVRGPSDELLELVER